MRENQEFPAGSKADCGCIPVLTSNTKAVTSVLPQEVVGDSRMRASTLGVNLSVDTGGCEKAPGLKLVHPSAFQDYQQRKWLSETFVLKG